MSEYLAGWGVATIRFSDCLRWSKEDLGTHGMGMDLHRQQNTFDALVTETEQVRRPRRNPTRNASSLADRNIARRAAGGDGGEARPDGLEPGRRSTQTDGLDIRTVATLGAPDVPSSTGNACTIHVSEMTADQSVSSCPRSPRTAGPSRMIAPIRTSCLRCPLRVSWTTCSSGRPVTCRAGSSRRSPPMCARRANPSNCSSVPARRDAVVPAGQTRRCRSVRVVTSRSPSFGALVRGGGGSARLAAGITLARLEVRRRSLLGQSCLRILTEASR